MLGLTMLWSGHYASDNTTG